MSIHYAMLLDGGFLRRKLGTSSKPVDAAAISAFASSVGRLPCLAGLRLHRIYFYDSRPLEGSEQTPLQGAAVDFGSSKTATRNKSLHAALCREPFFALRAVVGDPALREVVGADALAAVAAADLQPARRACAACAFALRPRAASPSAASSRARFLCCERSVLALDHDAGGQVRDADRRVGLVDVLAAGAGGAKVSTLQVRGVDVDRRPRLPPAGSRRSHAEVWMRPCDSVAGTRCTRCVPDSNFSRENAPRRRPAR
jgi:hypothetical protein